MGKLAARINIADGDGVPWDFFPLTEKQLQEIAKDETGVTARLLTGDMLKALRDLAGRFGPS